MEEGGEGEGEGEEVESIERILWVCVFFIFSIARRKEREESIFLSFLCKFVVGDDFLPPRVDPQVVLF